MLFHLWETAVSSIRGWKVGQPINNKTWWGGVPKWSTVRGRYWKNQAEWAKSNPDHGYGNNIPRMEKGLAPLELNKKTGLYEAVELHHIPPQREGGLFDFIPGREKTRSFRAEMNRAD